jgi:hypothetical protein
MEWKTRSVVAGDGFSKPVRSSRMAGLCVLCGPPLARFAVKRGSIFAVLEKIFNRKSSPSTAAKDATNSAKKV